MMRREGRGGFWEGRGHHHDIIVNSPLITATLNSEKFNFTLLDTALGFCIVEYILHCSTLPNYTMYSTYTVLCIAMYAILNTEYKGDDSMEHCLALCIEHPMNTQNQPY